VLLLLVTGCGASKTAWTKSVPVIEREPNPGDLFAYPRERQTVGVNPPGFYWTPSEKAESYRLEVRKATETSRTALYTEPQESTVYPPYQKLEPGEYVWQVVYLDASGAPAGVSKARRFELPEGIPVLLMPDVAALKKQLSGVRPRLFLMGDRLKRLQDAVARGAVPSWERMRQAADAALEEKSYPEPEPYRRGVSSSQEWNRTFTPGKVGSAHVARTALAYRITGDSKYLEGARRWLLTLAGWDPKGITSHNLKFAGGSGNDEASMPMLERMSLAWDWVGDKLTPEERQTVLAAMTERGDQVLRTLKAQDFLSHPFNNHSGRAIAFLGPAGLAFLGDIPEAEKWLDYVLRAELTSYPSYGSDEGGWAQGLSYWSFYIYCHTNFAQALRQATDTDLLQKPFFRNTGYFGVSFLPPYAPRGGFGDGAYHRPNESGGVLVDTLADAYRDPVLKWQAKGVAEIGERNQTKWREWFAEDVYATLKAADPSTIQPESPSKLDGSRYLSDIGWVAMHSALGDAESDVWALFKSSGRGSYSHSHADQNSFQLYAYGRALAVDSGYYPAYGSPHDNLYTRQTLAHNGILVNGRGQATHTWDAAGDIQEYKREGIITLVRGEAAEAYNYPQRASILRQWQRHLKKPVPSMEPKVETFERTLAFVASETRPVLVVHDYVRTGAQTTFDWLMHALNRMETDARTGAIQVRDGDARLTVRLVASVPCRFSQTDRFPIAPEPATNTAYILNKADFTNQWHLKATTGTPAREVKFLAVMAPYRASEPQPEIVPFQEAGAKGFRVAGTEVAAWWGDGHRGKISAGGLTGDGRFVLRVTEDGKVSTVVAQ
jgi:hypothetical protein